MGTTSFARASTLADGVRLVVSKVAAVGALPLSVKVKLGTVRSKFILAGLHGVEAPCASSKSFIRFCAAMCLALVRC